METLNNKEIAELRQWQRRMITILVVTMASLAFVALSDLVIGLSYQAAWIAFALLLGLAVLGGCVQFGQTCPRCGYRLGFQSRLLVPENCKKCGVSLKRDGERGNVGPPESPTGL